MRHIWKWFLAFFRLDMQAVCEMSAGRPATADYHDYPDNDPPEPWHFTMMKCRRCGKSFYI